MGDGPGNSSSGQPPLWASRLKDRAAAALEKVKDKATELGSELKQVVGEVAAELNGGGGGDGNGNGGGGGGGGNSLFGGGNSPASAAPSAAAGATAPLSASAAAAEASRCGVVRAGGHEVEGVSIGGQETCLILPRLKVAFDIGRCPQRAVAAAPVVLLTHGHLDHVGGLPAHAASRQLLNLPPPRYICPPQLEPAVHQLMAAAAAAQGEREPPPYDVLALAPGQEAELPGGQLVRPFAVRHDAWAGGGAQGYVIYSLRRKLKAELAGRPPEEVRALRESGVEVTEAVQTPEVAYTGDTTGQLLEDAAAAAVAAGGGVGGAGAAAAAAGAAAEEPVFDLGGGGDKTPPATAAAAPLSPASVGASPVLQDALRSKLLIIESTFLDDGMSGGVDMQGARQRGHTHVADLALHQHVLQRAGAVLLVHFSPRYRRRDVETALAASLPPALRARCTPFLNGFP